MKTTLYQINRVVTLTIATILFSTAATAHSHDPLKVAQDPYGSYGSYGETSTPQKQGNATVTGNTYSFTMTLPENPNSGFAKLSFSFLNQNSEIIPIPFNLQDTTAQISKGAASKSAIDVKRAAVDETGTLWVEFNAPIPANATLTVTFKSQKPLSAGQYTYSVAGYTSTKPSRPVFVSDGTFMKN
jgi:hypothetical protein